MSAVQLEEENRRLKEENEKLKKIANTQLKIIKNYEKRKNEYENIILKRAVSYNNFLKKKRVEIKESEEEEDEI